MKHGLLNPPIEASVCRKMIVCVEERIATLERELTSTTLERETYLEKIGAVKEARVQHTRLQNIYDKEFVT